VNGYAHAGEDKKIVVYHIGGEGDYGPTMKILEQLPAQVHLVVFEARSDTTDDEASKTFVRQGIKTTVVLKGIDEHAGRSDFNVNKFPLSSSLLNPSPLSSGEDPEYPHVHTWGQNTALHTRLTVDTMSLDDIVASGLAPPPDVISIDAQGAELRILRGARECLKNVLCVVSEVEFFEIYDGQGLFDDQMMLLNHNGFRLFRIMSQQNWHPGPSAGEGFLTVGEAVWFRFAANLPVMPDKRGYIPFSTLKDDQLAKLAALAYSFGALSYVFSLLTELARRSPQSVAEFRNESTYANIYSVYQKMLSRMGEYEKNPKSLRGMHIKRKRSIFKSLATRFPGYIRRVITEGAR